MYMMSSCDTIANVAVLRPRIILRKDPHRK
jgi:hypothetical protein